MKRKIIYIVGICILVNQSNIYAQSFDVYKQHIQSEFRQYKSDNDREFKEYRDRINTEFAEYMRKTWPEYESKPAVPIPDSPEPPVPVVKDPDIEPSNDPVPFDKVRPIPKPVEPPQPIIPMFDPNPAPSPTPTPTPMRPSKPIFTFSFYGQKCEIPFESQHRFFLAGINENNVADAWIVLSSEKYIPIISKCLEYRNIMHLCDWGYFCFLEQMTTSFFSTSQLNEARLMQMFILTQSGYKVRIARTGNKLVLLLPFKELIWNYSYLTLRGQNYFVMDKTSGQMSYKVLDQEFPKEQIFNLEMPRLPLFTMNPAPLRHLKSKHDVELSTNVTINRNITDFFNDYPLSNNWEIYSNASFSESTKEQLYPVLKRSINGKDVPTAANILLHFVQTAFDYATDEKQFGYERPLFADETIYYPYSDCEDRAIMYSILVRELLGLDVVLLHYPGHLATAVCFNNMNVTGDYLQIEGKRYIVCDPTYINSNIGNSMPQYKQTSAEVIKTGI